ncbi:enoyl-CoA hydratase [Vandammella animalimorsus]|uniref:Enoyl-CoA hydratase n=1 Tax=Vandammella animalimorsus TaxID=2029117 RepID=A0A3M6RR99_9BURK|nr:enoyl-CoA hydratase [Vandammella animalimorsus]RMX17534.1 enoyl-CoA hydratase [Vandammella animalimorsus]
MSATATTEQPLLRQRHGAVLLLSNNNVAARNALTPGFYLGLVQALREAAEDCTVGAVVLTGEGGHFCAGGDLRQLAQRHAMAPQQRREELERLNILVRAIADCSKPVIAAVEGAAAGAGLSLALACDMLVAAEDAVFSVAYVKVGLSPDGGATHFLAQFLSRQRMTQLCLTGERISGAQMHALGAVNALTPPGQARAQALELAEQIALGPMQAMADIKALCRMAASQPLAQQLEEEAQRMVQAQGRDEAREGIGAFLEKRNPDFVRLRQAPRD